MDTPPTPAVLTRRACLQKGSALIGLSTWVASGAHALAPYPPAVPADAIVIESGLTQAAAWARSVGADDRVQLFEHDVAGLFYGRLVPAWQRRGVRGLAGLTRAPALFLLEPLAAGYGLRTVALQRAPTDCAVLSDLCRRPQRHPAVVSAEPVRAALLDGDDTTFAWWMAPVGRSLHIRCTVMPS